MKVLVISVLMKQVKLYSFEVSEKHREIHTGPSPSQVPTLQK